MGSPWAEPHFHSSIHKLVTQIWLVDESQFTHLCYACIPELSYFVGPAEASPSEQTEHGAAKKEELRTLGALLTLYWLLRGSYDELTRSQSRSRYISQELCVSDDIRLTRASFDHIYSWVKALLHSPEQQKAMLAQMAIHDLGKVTTFAKWLWQQTGVPESEDHDAVMLAAMQKLPSCLPSFASLSPHSQQEITRGWSMGLNVGHFLQAEGPPALLRGTKTLLQEDGGRGAVEFFLLHALLDIAGTQGHVTLQGSTVLTEALCSSLLLARDAILLLQTPELSVTSCYLRYLNSRMKTLDLSESPIWSDRVAFMRLVCMLRVTDKEGVATLQQSWDALSVENQQVLNRELTRSGMEPGHEAILLYYSPQLFANALRLRGAEGLTAALQVCVKIFIRVREQVLASRRPAPFVLPIHIGAVAVQIDQLFAVPLREVTVVLNARVDEGRAAWQ